MVVYQRDNGVWCGSVGWVGMAQISDHDKIVRMKLATIAARMEMCLSTFRSNEGNLYDFEICCEHSIVEIRRAMIEDVGNE